MPELAGVRGRGAGPGRGAGLGPGWRRGAGHGGAEAQGGAATQASPAGRAERGRGGDIPLLAERGGAGRRYPLLDERDAAGAEASSETAAGIPTAPALSAVYDCQLCTIW